MDEYENMDDPGYVRRDVAGQQRFAETELDINSDNEGSERNYFMHQPGDLNYDDVESEVSASDPEGISAASSPSGLGPRGGGGGGSAAPDEAWDLGPMDIKFAEPVSTPSKSPEKLDAEERRPVLSRVESLSSSFKDFDMERGPFEPSGSSELAISGKPSLDAEYTAEVIDFPVAVEQTFVSHEDVALFKNLASHTSSLDVLGPGSVAPSSSVTPSERGAGGGSGAGTFAGLEPGPEQDRSKRKIKNTSLLKALATG